MIFPNTLQKKESPSLNGTQTTITENIPIPIWKNNPTRKKSQYTNEHARKNSLENSSKYGTHPQKVKIHFTRKKLQERNFETLPTCNLEEILKSLMK